MTRYNRFIFIMIMLVYGHAPCIHTARVALCAVATGKYDTYAQKMIDSARKFFCTEHDVHFFVFTDGVIEQSPDVTCVEQERLGWPLDTLMRFSIYLKNKSLFDSYDYIFATDADMLFVAPVGTEILSERVATQHPGFIKKRGTYETNPASKACVASHEGSHYFAGGFYGGSRDAFFKMMESVVYAIESDLEHNFIAVWHDESHLNRYFIDNKPTKILSPSYCYPENWKLPYKKRLLALDKNHSEMRK